MKRHSGKTPAATVRVRTSNRRAGENPELMFDRLERFANLDDGLKAFEAFAREYPAFLPVCFYDSRLGEEARSRPLGWQAQFYGLFRVFRDMLRNVWQRGSNPELAVLLGIDEVAWKIINQAERASFLDRVLSGYETSLQEAVVGIPRNYFTVPRTVNPDWRTGTFRYDPDTDFRRAVYTLFRQSWRAKICPRCGRYFVAGKPAQLYCSTKCYGAAKRDRDLEFWRNVGSKRRRERKRRS